MAIFLIVFFAFGFYAFWKRDKIKKASFYRTLENEKRKAREILSGKTKHSFSRKKKIGIYVSIPSMVLSIIFISYEEFMLFGLFFIISIVSALVAVTSGIYLDNPNAYFREQNIRMRPASPHRYKGNAHKYLLATTIVSLGVFVVLEYNLGFENMIEYWIAGLFGLIGIMGIFLTMAAWPRKNM
ncbi:MAG: hypothetical protein E4H21_11430 [Thermodesulfobacteriales bacterium]|nr:MAG: hypothetical protein E4H21_11430 [Thermodesulfobacteriales bacterium]